MADENTEYQARVQDTGMLALANVGAQVGLVLDAAAGRDIFRVNLADTTNKAVVVTELIDAVGDVNGKVVCKFLNAVRDTAAVVVAHQFPRREPCKYAELLRRYTTTSIRRCTRCSASS